MSARALALGDLDLFVGNGVFDEPPYAACQNRLPISDGQEGIPSPHDSHRSSPITGGGMLTRDRLRKWRRMRGLGTGVITTW